MEEEKEEEKRCHFCGLPLGDEYVVYKDKNLHSSCFYVTEGELNPSPLAEDLKRFSDAFAKQKSMSIDELFSILWATKEYAKESTCVHRIRNLMWRMIDMGVIEEAREERTVIRKVKVWRKK